MKQSSHSRKPTASSQTAVWETVTLPQTEAMTPERQVRFNELYRAAIVARLGQNFDVAFELFNEALRVNPLSAETNYELANLYQDVAGQDSLSLFSISDSLLYVSVQLAPNNKYYKIALIDSYIKQGRYAESIPLARDVAQMSPTVEDFMRLESLCEFAEDYEGALFALENLERIEGKSLENSLYQFYAYQQLGREAQGYRVMEDLCKAYPTELRYRVRMGDLYLSGGHEDIAIATYRDVLTIDPNNDAAQYAMLDYYLQKGDSVSFNQLLRAYLSNPRAASEEKEFLLEGYILEHGMESPAVLNLFQSVLSTSTPDINLIKTISLFLVDIDESYPSLSPIYKRILELDPSQDAIREKALRVAYGEGDEEEMLRLCSEGRLYAPTNAKYYFVEGTTLFNYGHLEEALEVLDGGIEHADASTPRFIIALLHATRAEILLDLDAPEDACAAYDSALVYDPGNPEMLANYATTLMELGIDLDKALSMSRYALDAKPQDAYYLGTYAQALAVNERYEEAREMADSALARAAQQSDFVATEEHGRLLDHTGDIYYHLGHTAEAVKFWQQALNYIQNDEVRNEISWKVSRRRIR